MSHRPRHRGDPAARGAPDPGLCQSGGSPVLVETVHRGLAENSVGPVIDQLPRADPVSVDELGFAALHRNGTQLLVRFVAAAGELGSLAGHWPFDQWGRLLAAATTTVSRLDRRLHHAVTVVTSG